MTALLFYALFAGILVGMYIAVRRKLGPVALLGTLGIVGSVVCVFCMTLAQGNTVFWAVVMGIGMGGLFSVLALAGAIYFSRSDERRVKFDPYLTFDEPQF